MDSIKNTRENLFNIEDAKPEDVEVMRSLVKSAWLELYPNETYGITRKDLEAVDWYSDLDRRRKEVSEGGDAVHVWVLKNEKGEIVGFCKVTKSEKEGEIKGMYVAGELRGKGLGKKLMQKAFEWLGPDMDIKLKVVSYNSNAIEFYKKMGFKETGNKVSYDGTLIPSGKDIPRIEMMKLHNA